VDGVGDVAHQFDLNLEAQAYDDDDDDDGACSYESQSKDGDGTVQTRVMFKGMHGVASEACFDLAQALHDGAKSRPHMDKILAALHNPHLDVSSLPFKKADDIHQLMLLGARQSGLVMFINHYFLTSSNVVR
jgi:hypothetical protein